MNIDLTPVLAETLTRGRKVYDLGKVRRRWRRGLFRVRGSQQSSYAVDIRGLLESPITPATCTCPAMRFNPTMPCKHVAAALVFARRKGWL